MIALSRVAVNHDGRRGSAHDPLVWDQGSKKKQRRTDIRVNVDLASLPGPWVQVHGGCITGADVAAWCTFTVFLGTLHWPTSAEDLGHFGVSFLEVLIFSSNGLGTSCSVKRLLGPMYVLTALFPCRVCLFQRELNFSSCAASVAVWFGLWAGIGRFLPCSGGLLHVYVKALGLGTVFARSHFTTAGELSPSMSSGCLWCVRLSSECDDGVFGWNT